MSICIGVYSFSCNSINPHYSIVHHTFLYTISSTHTFQGLYLVHDVTNLWILPFLISSELILVIGLRQAFADYDAGKIIFQELIKAQGKSAEDSIKRVELQDRNL